MDRNRCETRAETDRRSCTNAPKLNECEALRNPYTAYIIEIYR